ncbi:MAG TPA: ribonuclease [Sphingomicrobium sp.]|nr:ribonuclease [Sphingomicrobium sp.]
MPEWLIERGIGETRAVLIENGEIVEARIQLERVTAAGSVIEARLTDTGTNGRIAIAIGEDGSEYLLPRGAPGVTEGAKLTIEVTREAIPGGEPWKRPLARVAQGSEQQATDLEGEALPFPAPADRMSGWNDLIDEARTGIVRFAGGELRMSTTPAMTLIDVDGYLAQGERAVRGAAEAAKAIRRLDIGGSIGIDLPTAGSKEARQDAAAAIDALLPQPFERTAVNGFGFVQIVRPRRRASVLELAQDRAAFEGRALLRGAAFDASGPKRLVAHPAVISVLGDKPQWIEALAHQVGGTVELRADASIPMSGGYAESL